MNELELIQILKSKHLPGIGANLIGDDCTSLISPHGQFLVTTDLLMDGVHFETRTTSLLLIAQKSINVNLSDLAASGAAPHSLLVSLAIPQSWPTTTAVDFMTHMGQAAANFDAQIIGGDTNVWNGPLAINVVALGIPHWRGQITRSGARLGDLLFVTGPLGGSLRSGRHLSFTPRVRESQWLVDHFPMHAMMDLSDGLATDGRRMASASKSDFVIKAKDLPVHSDVLGSRQDRLHHALCDGEDFELLISVDTNDSDKLLRSWPWPTPLTHIGTVVQGTGELWLEDAGQRTRVLKSGFVHGSDSH